MKKSKLVSFAVIATLLCAKTLQAGINKKPDSSALATPPIYDQIGVVGSDSYGDSASFTDGQGNTTNITCVGSNCSVGIGISSFVILPDKNRLYIDMQNPAVDLDHWEGHFENTVYSTLDDHLYKLEGKTISFRIRQAAVLINGPATSTNRFLCVPLNVDLGGKSREDYAKHHSMEACHMITG